MINTIKSTPRDMAFFRRTLAEDRNQPRPDFLPELAQFFEEKLQEWKEASRCYDAARIELNIKTPREIQRENAPYTIRQPKVLRLYISHA